MVGADWVERGDVVERVFVRELHWRAEVQGAEFVADLAAHVQQVEVLELWVRDWCIVGYFLRICVFGKSGGPPPRAAAAFGEAERRVLGGCGTR